MTFGTVLPVQSIRRGRPGSDRCSRKAASGRSGENARMRANRRASTLGAGLRVTEAVSQRLPNDLARTLADGWHFDEDGAFLLRSQTVGSPRSADMDLTGWEAFQNHVHIPQDDLETGNDDWEVLLWARAVAFACQGLRSASGELTGEECLALVALGSWQDGATVRFHLDRGPPGWAADDLEDYEGEAVAVLSSAEIGKQPLD
jgi:hypothetical protein